MFSLQKKRFRGNIIILFFVLHYTLFSYLVAHTHTLVFIRCLNSFQHTTLESSDEEHLRNIINANQRLTGCPREDGANLFFVAPDSRTGTYGFMQTINPSMRKNFLMVQAVWQWKKHVQKVVYSPLEVSKQKLDGYLSGMLYHLRVWWHAISIPGGDCRPIFKLCNRSCAR